nr:hypothetical protein [Chloroflexota bacterium]
MLDDMVEYELPMFQVSDPKVNSTLRLLDFSLHSILQAYGRAFLFHAVLRHPLRTLRGLWTYRQVFETDQPETRPLFRGTEDAFVRRAALAGERLLVGTGFCQKPLRVTQSDERQGIKVSAQECPAGRFNHDCLYLLQLNLNLPSDAPFHPTCTDCSVRILGHAALQAGASFAVLTSAMDIAHDILFPALEKQRFTCILFAICPYSVEPMSLALLISGLEGYLFRYHSGSCVSYQQWLRADRGDKPERTVLSQPSMVHLLHLLKSIAAFRASSFSVNPTHYKQVGHIFCPC